MIIGGFAGIDFTGPTVGSSRQRFMDRQKAPSGWRPIGGSAVTREASQLLSCGILFIFSLVGFDGEFDP